MLVFRTTQELKQHLLPLRQNGGSIGLVPTMGALHRGHLSLIERSLSENNFTVCSIFVNPIQFNNAQDFAKYPRDYDKDIALLSSFQNMGVFLPDEDVMYKEKPQIQLSFGELENVMEGKFRPGHFNGVGIVVSKLFHLVAPHRVYFGQKDLQQCRVIGRLVKDLSFDLEMIICPTLREQDGLAMSSRNQRLNPTQRQVAKAIPEALDMAKDMILNQKKSIEQVKSMVDDLLKKASIQLEYFEIVDAESLLPITSISTEFPIALCIAAFVGEVRLIDNMLIQ
jgi:pantoate--beta-alanine ligase